MPVEWRISTMPQFMRSSHSPKSALPSRRTPAGLPAGTPPWITAELANQTIATWQPSYAQPLTLQDAIQILLSVGQLIEALEGSDGEKLLGAGAGLQPGAGAGGI